MARSFSDRNPWNRPGNDSSSTHLKKICRQEHLEQITEDAPSSCNNYVFSKGTANCTSNRYILQTSRMEAHSYTSTPEGTNSTPTLSRPRQGDLPKFLFGSTFIPEHMNIRNRFPLYSARKPPSIPLPHLARFINHMNNKGWYRENSSAL